MAEQSRELYRITGAQTAQDFERQINFILSRISDRLDQMEGLRGNPRFYKSLFEIIGQNLTAGQVLKAVSGEQAEIGTLDVAEVENATPSILSGSSAQIDLERSLISLIDAETDTVVHQFPTQWLEYNCEVFMFTTNERFESLAWQLDGDVSGPEGAVSSNLVEFDGTSGKEIKDGGLSHAATAAAMAHQVAEDTVNGLVQGNGAGSYAVATALSGNLLISIYDGDAEIIHQFPLEWLGYDSEVFGFPANGMDTPSFSALDHAKQHAITSSADHTSAATSGKMLKADANGLPVDATNTDAQVSAAVTASHSNASDHAQGTDTALGAVGTKNPPIDADKALYRDSTASDALVTSTWTQVKAFLKTYFDTLYVAVMGRWRSAAALADGATLTLPTITANYPAHGFIQCAHASTGVISESAEFEYGSTGAVSLIRGTANIEANGATAGKISIGAAVSENPVVIKNNLGGGVSVNAMVTLWYN